jgi:phage terminase large subunit-like protein
MRPAVPVREVEPRHHTARNLDRETLGPEVARIAQQRGHEPMPWQRLMWDVALELDPATGLPWYDTGVVTVQRQSGKTDALGDLATHRCMTIPGARAWLTMQQGKDASEWMRDKWHEDVPEEWVKRGHVVKSLRAGSEGVSFPATRGRFQVFAPKKSAMHSKQSDLTIVDEAWAHDADKGLELEQAIDPTQATRPGAQKIIASTAGDDGSEYLEGQLAAAIDALDDPESRTFLVDYGIPDDADPEDIAIVAAWHPAVGHTIDESVIAAARRRFRTKVNGLWVDDSAGFARAYGNRPTRSRLAAFPPGTWEQRGTTFLERPARVGAGFDVTPSGDAFALVVAWRLPDGRPVVEVVEDLAGTADAPGRIAALARKHRGTTFGYDTAGIQTLNLADTISRRHRAIKLHGLAMDDTAAGCAALAGAVTDGTLVHFRQEPLNDAVAGASKKPFRDGGWLWARARSRANIAPLVAATVALRVYDQMPAASRPRIVTGTRRNVA